MKSLLTFFLLFFTLSCLADNYSDEQIWVNLNAFVKLNDQWQFYGEYQPRFFDYSKYNGVTLHRSAVGRDLGMGFSAWAGYGFMTWNNRKDSKFSSKFQHEDRPFIMLMHNWVKERFKVTNRTRLEDRLFRHSRDGSMRLRHLLRLQYKFGESPWALALWDEWFWNANTIHPSAESHGPSLNEGVDQNRAFIGGAFYFGDKHQHMLETGYLNNFVHGATRNRTAHVWMTTLTGRF